jgi:cell division protein FtsI/penicillin-binding protein 2
VVSNPISEKTSTVMRRLLEAVVSEGGAKNAAVAGWRIGGKTGTAQKSEGRHYAQGLYRATFCGIVPATAPRLVVLVTLDFDERTRYHQGGNSAGPVFKRITEETLRYLMIAPDRPEELESEE